MILLGNQDSGKRTGRYKGIRQPPSWGLFKLGGGFVFGFLWGGWGFFGLVIF